MASKPSRAQSNCRGMFCGSWKGRRDGDQGLSFLYAIMQPPLVCVIETWMRASGSVLPFSSGLFAE